MNGDNLLKIISDELKDTEILFKCASFSPYNLNIKLEFEDCFYNYEIEVVETIGLNLLYEAIHVMKRINTNCNINNKIGDIQEKNGLLIGLYRLTEQHKSIYESGNEIYDSFVEQAGTYEDVLKSYNSLKMEYDEKVTKPINELIRKIDELQMLNKSSLNNYGITTRLDLSMVKSTIYISK